jgi:hypothetical protein
MTKNLSTNIININYLRSGNQYVKLDRSSIDNKDYSKYLRLEEFYNNGIVNNGIVNNGIVNNGPDMIIKTPPAPTTKQPPSIIKNSDIVYRPLNLVNKIADSEKCIKEFNRKRSLKKTT